MESKLTIALGKSTGGLNYVDLSRASKALKWTVAQMEKHYQDLAGWSVRNIGGYNAEAKKKCRRVLCGQ